MLENERALNTASDLLVPEDFYDPRHQDVFRKIVELAASGPVDSVRLADGLKREGLADSIGRPFILGLIEAYPTAAAVAQYARIVHDHSRLRRLMSVAHDLGEIAASMPDDVDKAVEEAERLVYAIARQDKRSSAVATQALAEVEKVLARLEEIASADVDPGFGSGIQTLDTLLGGFQPSRYVIVGASTSFGKTALLTQVGDMAARAGLRTLHYSLEMPRAQVIERILAQRSTVPVHHLTNPRLLTEVDWQMLTEAAAQLPPNLLILDGTLDIGSLMPRIRRLESQHGKIDVLIVDYVQLVENRRLAKANREERVGDVSRTLKRIANETGITVLAAAQLNRDYQKEKRRPTNRDLRESGSLEHDADIIMLLHRPTQKKDEVQMQGTKFTEIVVTKHRHGPTGIVEANFVESSNRFEEH